MKYLHINSKHIVIKHLLSGVLFGFLFPICAHIFEIKRLDLKFTMKSLNYIHTNNKLLFMIDTAPFFLGMFALVAGIIRDKLEITNAKLEEQVIVDDLTGLYNRRYVRKNFKKFIENAQINGTKISLICIDFDRFKMFNDTLGHDFGDNLLISVSRRFLKESNKGEHIIQLGGDVFMIIVENLHSLCDIKKTVQHYINLFKKPIIVDNKEYIINISTGVSIFPDHGEDIKTLFKHTDIAMYNNKNNKKMEYEIFNYNMITNLNENFDIENELQYSLKKEELFVVYQPIIDTNTLKLQGAEALLRWNNSKLGMVSPAKFIPVAESTNLIIDIGKWVLKEACIQNKAWQDKGYNPIFISVNISVNQLKHTKFYHTVKEILEETKLNPKYLKLEITESGSMENFEEIKYILKKIKKLNVKICIDDFGTGYSSLAQLKSLSMDTLKIDKLFVDDLNINISSNLITSAIVAMAKKLNLNIIAEGVETVEQFEYLKEINCDQLQGYLFSKPLEKIFFEKLFNNEIHIP
ncbi:bifunctional diguanylate cyclase/phosphodiesterase [Clostridium aestuarii]|uniref:Bifunctional diguanylate cyclase/phosphodiesterase n=1 Tax=Clostridium aestuarii TaxID=338193 RepID=A0ABT4CXE5_9CLOT|nr:bifunctional diguanylate cyclase/phosphodiesterase [Clostridium aestuarii]MCY6483022.1 bifunctional diguanylate cyclase/phosphodiesterase [Clostridium aestuarii]